METIFIYLLKSSGIVALVFLVYHFFLRKETFFNTNRWYLLIGLVTSVILPLFFIKKIIYVEKPKIRLNEIFRLPQDASISNQNLNPSFEINWFEIGFIVYGIVAIFLLLKVASNSISLYKILRKRNIHKEESHIIIDIAENVAPFSFFNFIVLNSQLYSEKEIQSILTHEKIHSQQKHSFDVLLSKLFSIVFWFNPFIHWYKNAIVQNLEYIADQKAIEVVQDKKSYQMTLLKVVTHQNCLPITNHFYQSLIKKRIVMLNKNQSHQRNSWKYLLVLPFLVAFVLLFQVKTIAQEKETTSLVNNIQSGIYITTDKNTSDPEMKKDAKLAKEKYGVTLKYSKIKRNQNGEITGIKITYKDKEGNTGTTQFSGNEPIKPIHFYKTDTKIGFGKSNTVIVKTGSDEDNFAFNFEFPEIQEAMEVMQPLEPMEAMEPMEMMEPIEAIEPVEAMESIEKIEETKTSESSRVYIQNDDDEPIVIIDGKIISGGKNLSKKQLSQLKNGFSFDFDSNKLRALAKIDIDEVKAEIENARKQVRKEYPEIIRQARENAKMLRVEAMEEAREQMKRAREEMQTEIRVMQNNDKRKDLEKARAEMLQAREDLLKARADMEKAKAELEKAKAELKK